MRLSEHRTEILRKFAKLHRQAKNTKQEFNDH
jgi:hypothetical protein